MTRQLLFDRINNRIELDKEDGNFAYFQALTLKLEYTTKVVTAGLIACIGDDVDRHRYSLEHKLVRANSIGDWANALDKALVGPPAQFFDQVGRGLVKNLTERVGSGDWRYRATTSLNKAAQEIGAETSLGGKLALRQCFDIGVTLRNRSRGHGAPTTDQCSRACLRLADGLDAVVEGLELFSLPWVYLHRNLSGKYRVSSLLGDTSVFDYLKRERTVQLPNGVFLYLDRPVHVPLIFSDPDVLDISLPNGNFRNGTFEILSYVTNEISRQDCSAWSASPASLPESETEGHAELEILGKTFSNAPPRFDGYVPRNDLEDVLHEELLKSDRHCIISLTGPGGIGKTAIAIAAIHSIAQREPTPYEVILWISARDIDLLESGPKPVSPRVITQRDIALAAVELLEPPDSSSSGFKPEDFFQRCLAKGAAGPTLFVLDNFETLQSPNDVFKWIDAHIRPPNKVLITTRFRDFNGDYAIRIEGMTDEEAGRLVDQHAMRLSVTELLSSEYKKKLIREAEGHPYVMKILLGQVAKEGRAVNPERIVASADDLLQALFERTYGALSPGGQRVFLLLCSWRVFVPEVAVEAVLLRSVSERFDVPEALRELHRFSLVDQIFPEHQEEHKEPFVGVPLAAAMYGRSKLRVSPQKVEVEEDRKLLMEFGAGKKEAVGQGILPRIENLVKSVAVRANNSASELNDIRPVLEYLARRVPKAYLQLSDLEYEVGDSDHAKEYLRNYLECASTPEQKHAWLKMATLCQSTLDQVGEIHALSETALLMASDQEQLGNYATRLNQRIRALKAQGSEDDWFNIVRVVRGFLNRVIQAMEKNFSELSATNCSRLAWLHLNVGSVERALDVARAGIGRDPTNDHCQNLIRKLDM